MASKTSTLISMGQVRTAAVAETVDPLVASLEVIRDRYLRNKKRDAGSFLVYCMSISNAVTAAADVSPRRAKLLLGEYLSAGLNSKRSAGNQRRAPVWMFLHLWHEIAGARGQLQTVLVGRVPAKQIADLCMKKSWGQYSAANVSDAFRGITRSSLGIPD